MFRKFKKNLWMGLLLVGLQAAWGFALIGPSDSYPGIPGTFGDDWQTTEIGYNPLGNSGAPPFFTDTSDTGPKNIGEEYRRNTPVMFYAYDQNFSGFFGANGEQAVDQAFSILNALTNVDSYSSNLVEFPLNSQGLNFQAQALGLLDLKSQALALMMEQIGLADSVRYIWVVHNRALNPPNPCPIDVDYLITMRNLDIITSPLNQVQFSPYVNGELYSYFVDENCDAPSPLSPPTVDAVELPVDPLNNNPPVSSGFGEDALSQGVFYTGLTRDDVAGLRYLMSSNNINTETLAPGSTNLTGGGGLTTNIADAFKLTTSNLTSLALASATNNPAALQALFPGIVITSVVTNFNGTFTYTFGNVVTNHFSTNTPVQIQVQTISFAPPIGSPPGTPAVFKTNISATTVLSNVVSGDFFLIPTNLCGLEILQTLSNNVSSVTLGSSGSITNSNSSSTNFISTNIVVLSTNFTLEVAPCEFAPGSGATNANTGQFEGIERIQFVRVADENVDPLTGNFFQPITNTYTVFLVPNDSSQATPQTIQRVVTRPDVLFSAADLAPGPQQGNPSFPIASRVSSNGGGLNFNLSDILPNLAGPGTIEPSGTIIFNKVGPVFENNSPANLNGPNFGEEFIWGSFDGTTNAPIVYPNGTSIATLESEALIQISPAALPDGTRGTAYAATLSVAGGQPPYTWSLAANSPGGLPPGLTLTSNPDGTATISSGTGTPTQAGAFTFIIQMNDSSARSVQASYSITIH